jgi:exonuclease SbcD
VRIFHTADLHYCAKHLEYVDSALATAWQGATKHGAPDCWVIAGDSFDSTMGIHHPAFTAFLRRVTEMGNDAPGIVLQGTFSHDYPGSLEPLKVLRTEHHILVADEPGVWLLHEDIDLRCRWIRYGDAPGPGLPSLVAICVPSLNRADPTVRSAGPQGYIRQLATVYRPIAEAYMTMGVPVILVTHGTVTGCVTESRHAMVSPDHEFSVEALAQFGADAVLLGHIHEHQSWRFEYADETAIVYAGSLAKLVYGHDSVSGYVEWELGNGEPTTWRHHPVASRLLMEFEYEGPPDMDELEAAAEQISRDQQSSNVPVAVRVRWQIDEEHAKRVDARRIRALFEQASASVKLVPVVNRIQSVRAVGIGRALTMEDKLGVYLRTTGDEDRIGALAERLALSDSHEPEVIVGMIAKGRPA